MKNIFVILLLLSSSAFAQDKPSTVDLKFGVGITFINHKIIRFENELTKKWNPFFSSSISMNFGFGGGSMKESLTVINGDINVFFSPFKNHKKHNFKVGTGLSFIYLSETRENGKPGFFADPYFAVSVRSGLGFNAIIDHEIAIGKRYLIGGRIIFQPYRGRRRNPDIYTPYYASLGVLVRFGIRL
jgi:hypothetical protein